MRWLKLLGLIVLVAITGVNAWALWTYGEEVGAKVTAGFSLALSVLCVWLILEEFRSD